MTATEVVDALNKASDMLHLQCDIQEKKEQIFDMEYTRCDNCDHWMRVTCRSENEFKMKRTATDHACGEFLLSRHSKKIIQIFEKELIDLRDRFAGREKEGHE